MFSSVLFVIQRAGGWGSPDATVSADVRRVSAEHRWPILPEGHRAVLARGLPELRPVWLSTRGGGPTPLLQAGKEIMSERLPQVGPTLSYYEDLINPLDSYWDQHVYVCVPDIYVFTALLLVDNNKLLTLKVCCQQSYSVFIQVSCSPSNLLIHLGFSVRTVSVLPVRRGFERLRWRCACGTRFTTWSALSVPPARSTSAWVTATCSSTRTLCASRTSLNGPNSTTTTWFSRMKNVTLPFSS